MKKLKLAVDTLKVESFETAGTRAERGGTVAAHMPKPTQGTCPVVNTYYVGDTCECTLEMSCVQTNCFNECFVLTADSCPA